MTDRRYTHEPCECGDPWCAGCEPEEGDLAEELEFQTMKALNQKQLEAIARWVDESCEVITEVIPVKEPSVEFGEPYQGHEVWIERDDGESDVVHVTLDGRLVEV